MTDQHSIQNGPPADDGPMVLAHEAVPGYRPVFYVCITAGILYLAFVLWQTW